MNALLGFDPREVVSRAMSKGLLPPPAVKPKPVLAGSEEHRLYMRTWRIKRAAELYQKRKLRRHQNIAAGLRGDGKPRVRKIYAPRKSAAERVAA